MEIIIACDPWTSDATLVFALGSKIVHFFPIFLSLWKFYQLEL